MRVLVTGSRDWTDREAIFETLDRLRDLASGRFVLVHGKCWKGADEFAHQWAVLRHGVQEEPHPADWTGPCREDCAPNHRRSDRRHPGVTYCPAAGHYRNQEMVDLGADEVRAFQVSGSRGTQDCIDRARAAGLRVIVREETE